MTSVDLGAQVVHNPIIELNTWVRPGDIPGYIQEQPIGKLHYVSFMDESDAPPFLIDSIFDCLFNESFRSCYTDRFYSNTRIFSYFCFHFSIEKIDNFLYIFRSLLPLHTCINILCVFSEDNDIKVLGILYW